jgi:hypothetical protein
MMSERDFADLAVSRDMVLWEIDKGFWRDWSPRWNDARTSRSVGGASNL